MIHFSLSSKMIEKSIINAHSCESTCTRITVWSRESDKKNKYKFKKKKGKGNK